MTSVNDTIVQASFTIITYGRKNIFIIQATDSQFIYDNFIKFTESQSDGLTLTRIVKEWTYGWGDPHVSDIKSGID